MLSERTKGVIDLRKSGKDKPSSLQRRLFAIRDPHPAPPPESSKRPLPLRARRRRVRALIAFGVFAFFGALILGVSWVSYFPQYNISSISVSGAHGVSSESISRSIETVLEDGAYHFISRRNVLTYPRESIEKHVVASFPLVKSAHITRPALLSVSAVITIAERGPFARWCTSNQSPCYFMDDGGFIYTLVGENVGLEPQATSSTFYIFSGGIASSTNPIGEWFERAHLPGLLSLLKFLGQAGFTPRGAHIDNGQDFSVQLGEGFVLKASYGADAGMLVKNLQLVLSSDALKGKRDVLEYIDLRFGNRVYYKLKGGKEVSAQ